VCVVMKALPSSSIYIIHESEAEVQHIIVKGMSSALCPGATMLLPHTYIIHEDDFEVKHIVVKEMSTTSSSKCKQLTKVNSTIGTAPFSVARFHSSSPAKPQCEFSSAILL
jgi:hypothetical protein